MALGTSLPELINAIGSAKRQVSDLSVGNILGANLANLSLVIAVAVAFTPVTTTRLTQLFDFPAMLALMGLLVWALWTQHRLTRREGTGCVAHRHRHAGLPGDRARLSRQRGSAVDRNRAQKRIHKKPQQTERNDAIRRRRMVR